MKSPVETYYRATARDYPAHRPLIGTLEAQVAVVGGGYAGLATALGLAERGRDGIVLVESEEIGHGASGRNGGFVFGGYSLGEGALLAQLGEAAAKRVYGRSIEAVNLIRDRIARYAIDCDLVDEGVIWANWFDDDRVLRDRLDLLERVYGQRWEWLARDRMQTLVRSPRYRAGAWERNAMHLHPLDYARGLARAASAQGVAVHEQTPAHSLTRHGDGWRIVTGRGELIADQVVLACGGYLAGLRPEIDRSILPIATYVMATEPLGDRLAEIFPGTRAAIYDTRFAFDYYRPLADTRLLWGGRISILDRAPAQVARLLKRDLGKVFPQLAEVKVDYAWSGLMSYARHQMPQIRLLDRGLWCAQGFGGHGLATTTAAGELLAAAIASDDEGWRDYAIYGLPSAMKPAGYLGAQATYWWYQGLDAWKDWRERA